ncbi:MAG: hypothetical protein WC936_04610 [Candidatus Nanoarchaeia archaeon]
MANTKKYKELEKKLRTLCDAGEICEVIRRDTLRSEVSTLMTLASRTLAPNEYFKLCSFLSNY